MWWASESVRSADASPCNVFSWRVTSWQWHTWVCLAHWGTGRGSYRQSHCATGALCLKNVVKVFSQNNYIWNRMNEYEYCLLLHFSVPPCWNGGRLLYFMWCPVSSSWSSLNPLSPVSMEWTREPVMPRYNIRFHQSPIPDVIVWTMQGVPCVNIWTHWSICV